MVHDGVLDPSEEDCQLLPSVALFGGDFTSSQRLREQLYESEAARVELSRRLISAQEADRTRISRELHDDIGQSLAILKIQMLRCGQPKLDQPGNALADLDELAARLDTIIYKVGRLSRDLHSSALEFLGLAAAVKSHCLQCSEHLNLSIQCCCQGVKRDLDNTVALAFFRIVQEGLHNAIKHSRATDIEVRIIGNARYLRLELSDNGAGFDLDDERFRTGLGLISMRERACLIGGHCKILSGPGRGTRIVVVAPVAPR